MAEAENLPSTKSLVLLTFGSSKFQLFAVHSSELPSVVGIGAHLVTASRPIAVAAGG